MTTIREELAELEHQQWQIWISEIIVRFAVWKREGEGLSDEEIVTFYENKLQEQIEKWAEKNISYHNLHENIKDLDRKHADKVIQIIIKKIDERINELKPHTIENMGRVELERLKEELEK